MNCQQNNSVEVLDALDEAAARGDVRGIGRLIEFVQEAVISLIDPIKRQVLGARNWVMQHGKERARVVIVIGHFGPVEQSARIR